MKGRDERGKGMAGWMALALILGTGVLSACMGGGMPAGGPPAGGGAPAVALQGNSEKGKELFLGTCAACHGPDAKGLPGLGKDLTTSAFVRQQTDAQLLEFIKKGRPATDPANTTGVDMPPKGGNPALTDQDLADIIAFIRTFNPHQP